MDFRIVAGFLLAVLAPVGCSSADPGIPTEIVCDILSWEDPQTVRFPLDSGLDIVQETVDVGGLMLVEFSYRNRGLAFDVIDISEGERDFIQTDSRFIPQFLDLDEAGEVVVDSIQTHPTVRIDYRIRCVTA